MTVGEVISRLRNSLKANSDDSSLTDAYLYNVLKSYRLLWLERSLRDKPVISPLLYSTVCMPLEEDTYHNCECTDVGCLVNKSVYEIPAMLYTSKTDFKVLDLEGKEYFMESPEHRIANRYSVVLKHKNGYWIENRKLIVWDRFKKLVMIRGIFEDPTELSNIKICPPDGYEVCEPNVMEVDFAVEGRLIPIIIDSALKEILQSMLRLKEDKVTNDIDEPTVVRPIIQR